MSAKEAGMERGIGRRAAVARAVVYAGVLYASFAHNVFWVPDGVYTARDGFRTGYAGYDSDLVVNRLGMVEAPAWQPLYWHDYLHGRGGFVYTSQVGLPGIVLGAVYKHVGGGVEEFAARAAYGAALLTAGVLALFFGSVARRIGPTAADVAVVLTAWTPVLLPFASSLYWAAVLLFGPFVVAWLLVPRCAGSPARFTGLMLLTAGLVCLKCLCGYEYITTVVLGPGVAVVYHRAAAGGRVRGALLPAALLAAAGCAGFAGALGLHAAQVKAVTGEDLAAVLGERVQSHSGWRDTHASLAAGCVAPDPAFLPASVRPPARMLLNYFWHPAVATPTTWGPARGFVSFGVVVIAAAGGGWAVWRRRDRLPPAIAALAPALAAAFVAGASWHGFALTHTCFHQPYNLVTYAVPFLLLAFTLGGYGFARLAVTRPWLRALPAVLLAASVVGNGIAAASRPAANDAADERAEAAAAAHLRGETVPTREVIPVVCPLIRLDDAPRYLHSDVWLSTCRVRHDFAGPGTPTRLVNGWFSAPPTAGPGETGRVVATAGGKPVPARVAYYRLTLVDRTSRGRSVGTGFTVAVAERDLPPGETLRLFAVTGDGFDTVTELPPAIERR